MAENNNKKQFETAVALCSTDYESISDFQLRKKLKPLLDLDKVKKEKKKESF